MESDIVGWINNEVLEVKTVTEVRKSDGESYYSLSEEEQDLLDDNPDLLEEKEELVEIVID